MHPRGKKRKQEDRQTEKEPGAPTVQGLSSLNTLVLASSNCYEYLLHCVCVCLLSEDMFSLVFFAHGRLIKCGLVDSWLHFSMDVVSPCSARSLRCPAFTAKSPFVTEIQHWRESLLLFNEFILGCALAIFNITTPNTTTTSSFLQRWQNGFSGGCKELTPWPGAGRNSSVTTFFFFRGHSWSYTMGDNWH